MPSNEGLVLSAAVAELPLASFGLFYICLSARMPSSAFVHNIMGDDILTRLENQQISGALDHCQ